MAAILNFRKVTRAQWAKASRAILLRRLLDAFDQDPDAILAGDRKKLLSVGIGQKAVNVLAHWSEYFDLS